MKKCLKCGKEIPYNPYINTNYCSNDCENKHKIKLPEGFEKLFGGAFNNK